MTEPSPAPALAPPDEPAWSSSGIARALAKACFALGVGAGVGYLISHEHAPGEREERRAQAPQTQVHEPDHPSRPPPAGDMELSLLAPVKEGGTLAGYTVSEIDAIGDDGQIKLLCHKDAATVELDVALQGEGTPAPPATAGRYAVYYSARGAPPAEGDALAHALAAIVETNASARVPRGMKPFVPERH